MLSMPMRKEEENGEIFLKPISYMTEDFPRTVQGEGEKGEKTPDQQKNMLFLNEFHLFLIRR